MAAGTEKKLVDMTQGSIFVSLILLWQEVYFSYFTIQQI